MGIIGEKDRAGLSKMLGALPNIVKLVVFKQEFQCQYCHVVMEMTAELASMSEKILLEQYDFVKDAETAKKLGIDKIPAVAVLGAEKDYGIRFFGVPGGYEFLSLLEAIKLVGNAAHGLPQGIVDELNKVDAPVKLQAVVSPTCPYCPRAVITAHKFALASDFISADMIEINEYPHLAVKYNVQGVPNTIINEKVSVVGAVPEIDLVRGIMKALGK
jgi:glutaredoxin-like protein